MRMIGRIVLFGLFMGVALALPLAVHAGGRGIQTHPHRHPHNGSHHHHVAPCYISGCYEWGLVSPPIVVVRPPRVVFGAPRVIFGAPPITVIEEQPIVRSVPQQAQSQWSPTTNFSDGPNVDLSKVKRTIHYDKYGQAPAPPDLIPGAVAIICNAPSRNYKLYSEGIYKGTQYFKQQCWLYWHPPGQEIQHKEIPGD